MFLCHRLHSEPVFFISMIQSDGLISGSLIIQASHLKDRLQFIQSQICVAIPYKNSILYHLDCIYTSSQLLSVKKNEIIFFFFLLYIYVCFKLTLFNQFLYTDVCILLLCTAYSMYCSKSLGSVNSFK